MTQTEIGVGLEVSSTGCKAAAFCDHTARTLVDARLPVMYEQSRDGLVRRWSISNWLSDKEFDIPTSNGNYKLIPRDVTRKIILSAIEKASALLNRGISGIQASVASSLGQRDRVGLRNIIQELGYDVQLFNEDKAVLKACPDLTAADRLLLFNVRYRSVDISWYVAAGQSLSLENLEVLENCGLDPLDYRLLNALQGGRPPASSLLQLDYMLAAVRQIREEWSPGRDFIVPDAKRLGFYSDRLSADHVAEVFEKTFAPALGAVRRLVPSEDAPPTVAAISPPPPNQFFLSQLSRALGVEARPLLRDRVIEGAAIQAWEAGGKPDAQCPAETEIPVIIGHAPDDRPQKEKAPLKSSREDSESFIDRLQQDDKPASWEEMHRRYLDGIVKSMESFDIDSIRLYLPTLVELTGEMLAKTVGLAAKKMIAEGKYEDAYKIYKNYYRRDGGFNYLAAPAVGLCLGQAKNAYRAKDGWMTKRWCNRGLEFDRDNRELLELKKLARY